MVPTVCFTSRKAFIHAGNTGFNGSVFSKGDAAISDFNGCEVVIQVESFLSVKCSGVTNRSTLFVVGMQYPLLSNEDGSHLKDFWRGFIKVKDQPQSEKLVLQLSKIKSKVILYKLANNCFCVADYQRQERQLPYEVVVPIYFENGDMVHIQGEQVNDIWHGHIQNVDHHKKTIYVFFYVESNRLPDVYVRETQGRHGLNTVYWDSAVGIAKGQWITNNRWKKLHV